MNPVPAAPHLRKRRSRARGPMWLQSRWLRRNHPAGGGWGRSHRAGALPRAAAIFPRRSTIDEPGDEDGADVLVAGVRLRTAGGGGRRVRRARAAGAPPGRPAGGVRDGGALPDGPRARPPRRGAGGRARALVDGRGGGMALLRGDRALLREPLRAGAHRHPRAGRGDAAGRPLLPRRVGRARARRTRLDADDLKAIAYAWAEAAEKHRTSAGSGPSRTGAPTASCADGALSSPTRGGGAVDPFTLRAHPGAPTREESHAGCSPAVAGSYQIRVKSGASEAWVRGPAIDPSACKVPRSRMLQRDRPQDDVFKMVAEQRLFTRTWYHAKDAERHQRPASSPRLCVRRSVSVAQPVPNAARWMRPSSTPRVVHGSMSPTLPLERSRAVAVSSVSTELPPPA